MNVAKLNQILLDAIRAVYDTSSDPYYAYRLQVGLALDKIEEAILRFILLSFPDKGIKIQEIGGGIGQLSLALGLLGYESVTMVDSSQVRSGVAQELASYLGLSGCVSSLCTRYPNPDFAQAQCDLILGTNTIGWWAIEATTKEWDSILTASHAILDLERFGLHRPGANGPDLALERLRDGGFSAQRIPVPELSLTHIYHLTRLPR